MKTKKKLFGRIKRKLKKYRSHPKTSIMKKDWKLHVQVPENHLNKFINSILSGMPDFAIDTGKTNILLCALPKSASLHLTQLLARSFGYDNHQIGFNRAGGEIYYPRLLSAIFTGTNTISHCHAAPQPYVIKLIRSLNLQPIVLTRNLLDVIVSRKDMLLKDKWAGPILSPAAINTFINGTEEYQIDVIIEVFAGGYINFCSGWDVYRNDSELKPIFITFEEMIKDHVGLVDHVAEKLDEKINPLMVSKILKEIRGVGGINLNKGVIGRGKLLVNKRQINKLKHMAEVFGCCNQEFLGFEI